MLEIHDMLKSGSKIEGDEGMVEECSSENIGQTGQRGQSVISTCNMATIREDPPPPKKLERAFSIAEFKEKN